MAHTLEMTICMLYPMFCGATVYYLSKPPVASILLKALKDGVADGSLKPDINIYQVYQIVHNVYTGTSIYSNVYPDFDPFDTIKFTKELIANYIKNDK